MICRELAGSDRVRLAMPARAAPAVACHLRLDRPLCAAVELATDVEGLRLVLASTVGDCQGWIACRVDRALARR